MSAESILPCPPIRLSFCPYGPSVRLSVCPDERVHTDRRTYFMGSETNLVYPFTKNLVYPFTLRVTGIDSEIMKFSFITGRRKPFRPSETLPSACYIFSDKSSTPFYSKVTNITSTIYELYKNGLPP